MMTKRMLARIVSLSLAVTMLLSCGVLLTHASDVYEVMAFENKIGIIDMHGSGEVGQRMYVNGPFCAVSIKIGTHKTTDSDISMSVFAWTGDYESTVEAEPLATTRFVDCVDNATNWFEFGKTLPAGEYLFLLHELEGQMAIYASGNNKVSLGSSYHNGNEMMRDLFITVRFTERVETPFVAKSVKVKAYGEGYSDYHRILAEVGELGQRVKINAPFTGFAFEMPTWSTTSSSATLSAYTWKGSYEETVSSEPIGEKRFDKSCVDNAAHWVYFDEAVPAGEYLFLIHDVLGTVGCYYYSQNTVSLGYTYMEGTEQISDLRLTVCFESTPKTPFLACHGAVDDIDGTHKPPAEYVIPEDSLIYTHPVAPDTWVFTDGLGRVSLTNDQVGDVREDKILAMFYWPWHISYDDGTEAFNLQEFIEKYPEAQNDVSYSGWNDEAIYYWNEPIYGYYATTDEWVLRRQAELIANAGVDVVFSDNSNGVYCHRNGYTPVLKAWSKALESGVKAPKLSFCLPFWEDRSDGTGMAMRTVDQLEFLYLDIFREGKYQDMWFYYEGKPMMMGDGNFLNAKIPLQAEIINFFTFRKSYNMYVDNRSDDVKYGTWAWSAVSPQPYYYKDSLEKRKGNVEQISVSVAVNYDYLKDDLAPMNGQSIVGRSYTTDYESRYLDSVSGKNTTLSDTSLYGYHFAEQFEYALEIDPKVVFVTGWNEWTVSRHTEIWKDVENSFADQFNDEFSRDIEPSKGALKDHYYYQLVNFARRFKGAAPIPAPSEEKSIDMSQGQEQWKTVQPYFAAYIGNTEDRDSVGRADVNRYVDRSGRNDIIGAQVARDGEYLYFNVECAEDITPYTDNLWMNLYIDVDAESAGWESFDFVLNKTKPTADAAVLERFTGEGYASEKVADVEYNLDGRYLTVKIAKANLGLSGEEYTVNFLWTDNVHDENDTGAEADGELIYSAFSGDILDFYTSGDVAPGARFKYSYVVKETVAPPTVEDTTASESDTTAAEQESTEAHTTVADVTEAPTEESVADGTTSIVAQSEGCKSMLGTATAVSTLAIICAAGVMIKKRRLT